MWVFVYLVLTSCAQALSYIVGNSVSAVDAQKVFMSTCQAVFEHPLSKVDFSVGTDIYILPSNLNLKIRKTARHNNKILISNIKMKISANRNINNADV